ncbi:MAG: HAMP domain-containing histidine kinase [Chloroflexi bacterium]|nr:HAMP domain-containing histidine kinase [Chloroflexota bacterium]MCI0576163.1 HAMP domain-containing histidine kinase [Chloroflexota bacterium]MCI0645432.1 HAMP domain-containing histidine kinase [Chloroflexota bacterium]MCI0731298.1 HAMP domain-containing histidine kinase [Chloroflexota bacterium]
MTKFLHSLYFRITIPVILLTLFMTTAVALYNARIVEQEGLAQAQANAHLLATALDAGIQEETDLEPASLQAIIDNLTITNPDTQEFNIILRQGNGSTIVASNDPLNLEATSPEENQALLHSLAGNEPVVVIDTETELVPVPGTTRQEEVSFRYLALTAPIRIDNVPVGAINILFSLAKLDADLQTITRSFVIVAMLETVGIFLVLSLLLNHQVLRPLASLGRATTAVTQGDLSNHVPIFGPDEITQVMAGFNMMTTALAAKAQAVAELEQLRDDLTSMIVHDMKNPLHTIQLANSLLQNPQTGSLTTLQLKSVDRSQRATDRLLSMILTLLDIRRLESGQLKLEPESLDSYQLVTEAITAVEAEAQAAQQIVQIDVNEEAPPIMADKELLYRVLINLLTNAINHSQPASQTVVQVQVVNGWLELRVIDEGEGIAPEDQEQIFKKFTQASGRKRGGKTDTGLGLAFCRLAVEAHGGTIHVESPVKDGIGSAFILQLPLLPDSHS